MNNPNQETTLADELNVTEALEALNASKLFMLTFFLISLFLGVRSALSQADVYTSQTVLIEASGASNDSGGSLGGLSILMGGIGGDGPSKANTAIFTMKSRDFFLKLLNNEKILENLVAIDRYDPVLKEIIYNSEIYNSASGEWLVPKPSPLAVYGIYQSMISGEIIKGGFTELTVTHQSPEFAFEFLSQIVKTLNNETRQRDIAESEEALEYLNAQLTFTTEQEIRIAVGQLIEMHLKKLTMAKVKQNYVLEPLDNAFIPEQKSGPDRVRVIMSYAFFGFFLSFIAVLTSFFLFGRKKIF
jgi:hypothetical protein